MAAEGFEKEAQALIQEQKAVISFTWTFEPGLDFQSTRDFDFTSELLAAGGNGGYEAGEPIGYIHYPVFDEHEGDDRQTVAVLSATVSWKTYFVDLLPENVIGVHAVVENSHGQAFTYEINGEDAVFMGLEDLHDKAYDAYALSADYSSFADDDKSGRQNGRYSGTEVDNEYISYRIHVYPSAKFEDDYVTNKPLVYASLMVLVFLLTAAIFLLYDYFVARRQKIVLSSATNSNAVISSLFPENVRERLMNEAGKQEADRTQTRLGEILDNGVNGPEWQASKPIADFFPETTIMVRETTLFIFDCQTFDDSPIVAKP